MTRPSKPRKTRGRSRAAAPPLGRMVNQIQLTANDLNLARRIARRHRLYWPKGRDDLGFSHVMLFAVARVARAIASASEARKELIREVVQSVKKDQPPDCRVFMRGDFKLHAALDRMVVDYYLRFRSDAVRFVVRMQARFDRPRG
jgi:hypothetical protein